jgi:integrase/recombinase XerD
MREETGVAIVPLETKIEILPDVPLEQNPAVIYLSHLRPSGRRSQQIALNIIAGLLQPNATFLTLAWQELRYQHCTAIATKLAEKYKPAGCNRMLSALRGVLKEAWKLGLMDAESYHRAVSIKSVRGESLLRGRALKAKELQKLLAACAEDKTNAGLRDAALLVTLAGSGLRRSEVVNLDLGDLDVEEESLTIREAKGGKDRLVYLAGGAGAVLEKWLKVRGECAGALFYPVKKNGELTQRRMTAQAILLILEKRAKEAGVNKFSPHDLRRTFISDLLDAGVDLSTAQKLAGHSNVTTTVRYDRRGEEAKKKAAKKLQMPVP